MEKNNSTRLGQILIEKGLLTAAQLDIAIGEQTKRRQQPGENLSANTSLGEILIELGFINRLALNRGLNWQSALRKMAIVMSFCAPLMTASYSAAAANAFTPPSFTARSSSSSAASKPAPSFTKSSSSSSSTPSSNYSSASSMPELEVVSSSAKSSSSSSKSSVAPNQAAGPDLTAPQMPNKISVVAARYDRVHLSWIAATDNIEVTRYRIYRDQVQIDTLESEQTQFMDFSVAPGKNYLYGVSAGDAVGNWSAIKSVFVLTDTAPAEVKISSSSASSAASSVASSVANIASSSSSKAPAFTSSSAASAAPSSSASSISSKAASSSPAISSSSSSKAAVSSSSSSLNSSAASSAASAAAVAGPVNLDWTPPVARENGNTLDITEVGGYELRYRKVADPKYTYISINDAWTNTYHFSWLDGSYVFQIAAYDKNGLYSTFVDLVPK